MQQSAHSVTFLGTDYPFLYITDRTGALHAVEKLQQKECQFIIDTETKALPKFKKLYTDAARDPHRSDVRLVQIFTGQTAVVLDMLTIGSPDFLIPFLESKSFIAHNAIFDLQYFLQMGVKKMDIGCTYVATKLLYHALYADDSGLKAGLADVVHNLLGTDLLKKMQLSDWSVPELTYEQIEYAALDVISCGLIAPKLVTGLQRFNLLEVYKLFKDSQWPLAHMQLNGMHFDQVTHRGLIDKWRAEAYAAKQELLALTKLPDTTAAFIGQYLEENLTPNQLAAWPKTESGRLSTDAHTFSEFSWVPIVKPFSKFQKASTLSSTFGSKLQEKISSVTRRLHTQFRLCGARTGRLSSAAPNLQNAPRSKEFRALFTAKPGHVLIVADYSQIELRVAAEISGDREMQRVFREGSDLHRLTASRVLNKKISDVTDAERQIGKSLGLGLLYGLGSKKFAHYAKKGYDVDISESMAVKAIEIYRETYSGFRQWQLDQAARCKDSLYAETPLGKIRRLNEDNYYGAGLNVPIQGGAAEIILSALVELGKRIDSRYLVNTVHDEILLEVPDAPEIVAGTLSQLEQSMTLAYTNIFECGILTKLVDAHVGRDWASAKEKR